MSFSQAGAASHFIVITGLSGSGKTTALKSLEDLGFYAVDNLPVQLLPAFVNLPVESVGKTFKAALGMDVRAPGFIEHFPPMYKELVQSGYRLELLFLEASQEVLIRRFSQTRRQHPLAQQEGGLAQGIEREKRLMQPIRDLASQVLDTSRFTIHELRHEVQGIYSDLAESAGLQVNLISFGYKYGHPAEADLVLDVRFLDNPYFVEELRPLDGRDERVVDYVFRRQDTWEFLRRIKELLDFLLPRYQQEGKTQLTIAIGCTGGRHRSVAVSEWLAKTLSQGGRRVTLRHRDIDLG